MKRLSLAIILILALALPSWATTYYVNTAADPGGDGTTQALTGANCAFKTVAQVNAGSFSAGDSILFNRGNTWREQLTAPGSGASGNVITYGAYGTGAQPIINGADLAGAWTNESGNLWYCSSVTWTPKQVIRNAVRAIKVNLKASLSAEFQWWYDSANSRVYLYSTTDPAGATVELQRRDNCIYANSKSYLTFDSLDVYNADDNIFLFISGACNSLTFTNINSKRGNSDGFLLNRLAGANSLTGLTFTNFTDTYSGYGSGDGAAGGHGLNIGYIQESGFNTVALSNVVVTYAGVHGAAGVTGRSNSYGIHLAGCNGVTLNNCEVSYTSDSALYIEYASQNVTVSNSSFHNNAQNATSEGYGIGIGGLGTAGPQNIIIQNSELYNNKVNLEIATTPSDAVTAGCTIQYCHVYNGTNDGLKIGGGHTGINLYYNIVHDNGSYGLFLQKGTLAPTANVYNNVFRANTPNVWLGADVVLDFRNNILAEAGGTTEINKTTNSAWTCDYNLYYHPAGGTFMAYNSSNYSFADWKTQTSKDGNSVNANPAFLNAGGSFALATDFKIGASSPCKDAGVDVGLTTDYWGNRVPQ